MASQVIGYLEAWSLWSDGVDIKSRVLWGLEIYWWARMAKVAALLGGLAILTDIVGTKRLQEWLATLRKPTESILMVTVAVLCLVLPFALPFVATSILPRDLGLLTLVLVPVGLAIGAYILDSFIKGKGRPLGAIARVVKLTEHGVFVQFVRITSLLLVIAAFHFDFLAS
ncbi:hypothetical protein FAF44_19890 [Nonomuraea sp. MG754425]|uniref:hypothetical protein n=1 Tax=Nonomuraea sp. MG754425 TaxID=2570319 RepID=UPI001F23FD36|nr:hypothetical protein [Nonomuraea sp. MG754425]MCF6470642.1 hypothetical protein [Nonomuraea sp. MG754425]